MLEECRKAEIIRKGQPPVRADVAVSGGRISLLLPADAAYDPSSAQSVVFYDPAQGLVPCTCRLSAPTAGPAGSRRADCRILRTAGARQRRQDVKVRTSASVPVSTADGRKSFTASMRDISAGGTYLEAPVLLPKGTPIVLRYDMDGRETRLDAMILRIEAKGGGYGYGCRFMRLDAGTESMLRRHVFRLQLEERRKRKRT